jgi:hypothetical protein
MIRAADALEREKVEVTCQPNKKGGLARVLCAQEELQSPEQTGAVEALFAELSLGTLSIQWQLSPSLQRPSVGSGHRSPLPGHGHCIGPGMDLGYPVPTPQVWATTFPLVHPHGICLLVMALLAARCAVLCLSSAPPCDPFAPFQTSAPPRPPVAEACSAPALPSRLILCVFSLLPPPARLPHVWSHTAVMHPCP